MRTVAIIQARMDSERLPGKVLKRIGDRSVLAWVVHRVRQIKLDGIVVATTDRPSDDPIEDECRALGVECFRSLSDDVLDRYYHAATRYGATHVLRVTADCPMLDPALNQRIIDMLVSLPYLDYVGSTGWSDGVGQEAFTFDALDWTWYEAGDTYDREHVVPYMIRNLRCAYIPRHVKLSLDTPEELEFMRRLHSLGRFEGVFSSG